MERVERAKTGIEPDCDELDRGIELDDGQRRGERVGTIRAHSTPSSNTPQLDDADSARHDRHIRDAQVVHERLALVLGEKELYGCRRVDVEQGLIALARSQLVEHLGQRPLATAALGYRRETSEIAARPRNGQPASLELGEGLVSLGSRYECCDEAAVLGDLDRLTGLDPVEVTGEVLPELTNACA